MITGNFVQTWTAPHLLVNTSFHFHGLARLGHGAELKIRSAHVLTTNCRDGNATSLAELEL